MCGIAGIWNHRTGRPADPAVLRAMVAALRHRGPDQEGFTVDGPLALGAARLCVIEPEHGRQPMANEDGSVILVFNGEVYNHAELRAYLESRGHTFRTRCDTEVVVRAWEEWGSDCLDRFDGMFGLAIFDAARQELLLARDRLGIKPLYYVEDSQGVAFASELKGLIPALKGAFEPDLEALDDFMTYEYVPAPRTILRDVRKLPPATWLRFRPGQPAGKSRYWLLSATALASEYAASADGLRHRLAASVSRRVVADVPVGVFLSGGIDSSIVISLMAGTGVPLRAYSVGFEDASYNELPYARQVAAAHRASHRESLLRESDWKLFERVTDAFDEPFADGSAFATLRLSELARRDVTVALSGDGGDELFAGYEIYRAHRWAHRLRHLVASRPWSVVERVLDWLPPGAAKKGPVNLAQRFAAGMRIPEDLEHARWWVFWDMMERRALYTPALRERLDSRDCLAHYRERLAEGAAHGFEGLQRQLYADATGYLPDDILTKVDRTSMAVGLEARVPFLDHGFVEYAFTLPDRWKLRGRRSKVILRDAFSRDLPAIVSRRGKQGFSVPLKNWLRGPMRPLAHELLSERRVRDRGWFEPLEVARLIAEHESGRANHAHRLWCLMSLELSLQRLAHRLAARPVAAPTVEL